MLAGCFGYLLRIISLFSAFSIMVIAAAEVANPADDADRKVDGGTSVSASAASSESIELAGAESDFKESKSFVRGGESRTVYVVHGLVVAEGDIVLGKEPQLAAYLHKQGAGYVGNPITPFKPTRWDHGIVPYKVAANLPKYQKDLLRRAIAHWEDKTSIRFRLRDEDADRYPNYVLFSGSYSGDRTDGREECYSAIGMQGGEQIVNIDYGKDATDPAQCGFGNIIHEIGHAIGLQHEHSRSDRDSFIKVIDSDILDGQQGQFAKFQSDETLPKTEYDYGSIMHYGRTAFAKKLANCPKKVGNECPTIEPLKDVEIGQRRGLSTGDVATVALMYPKIPLPPPGIASTRSRQGCVTTKTTTVTESNKTVTTTVTMSGECRKRRHASSSKGRPRAYRWPPCCPPIYGCCYPRISFPEPDRCIVFSRLHFAGSEWPFAWGEGYYDPWQVDPF